MASENGKDVANSLSGYSNTINKETNLVLDSANQINKWYEEQVNKIVKGESQDTRLETNVNNDIAENSEEKIYKLQTKIDEYTEIQTNNKNKIIPNKNNGKLQTISRDETLQEANEKENEVEELKSNKGKLNSKIATAIKSVKFINNTTNRFIKTGRTINTATNEGGLKSFEKSSSRIMTKPVREIAEKITSKATNKLTKETQKIVVKGGKKAIKQTVNVIERVTKIFVKLTAKTMETIISMLPSIAPVIIIIVIIATIGSFFNLKTTHEADNINFSEVSNMIIVIEDEKLQAIYNEFLKNMGKPYLMDHSNLSHDTCMEYYDCSSWVIHCLAHTGIKTIPNTRCKWNI